MLVISYFDAAVVSAIGLSLYTFVIVPLAIRYGTPDKKETN